MKFREVVRELKKDPRNGLYYLQGWINWFLHKRAIKKYFRKSKECPECFEQNQCMICGCSFNPLALSSKKCDLKKKQEFLLKKMMKDDESMEAYECQNSDNQMLVDKIKKVKDIPDKYAEIFHEHYWDILSKKIEINNE